MDTVFVVVYQQWDDFEVLEVFKKKSSAERYIENKIANDEYGYYPIDTLHILEKNLFN